MQHLLLILLCVHLQEVDAVVERLHSAARSKEGKVEAALSFKQYQELKACTFTPEITRSVPKQTVRTGQ
jgi:gamma-glutamyl-gamma-aminobutyrate hydrolase PuuD